MIRVYVFLFILTLLLYTTITIVESFDMSPLHPVTNIMIQSCKELQIPYIVKHPHLIIISKGNHSIRFYKLFNNLNNIASKNITKNKAQTSTHLSKCGLPIPKHQIVPINEMSTFRRIIQFPIVIKPVDGTAGQYVFVNIRNQTHLNTVIRNKIYNKEHIVQSYQTQKGRQPLQMIVEEYLKGHDYRILCYKNTVLDIVKRTRPRVIGNAKHTLNELVHFENRVRMRKGQHKIVVDIFYLQTLGIDYQTYVPKHGEIVTVNPLPNLFRGGTIERIPLRKVHPDNLDCFRKVNQCLGLVFCGIDFISPDIRRSYKHIRSGINEVNSSPDLSLNCSADDNNRLLAPIKLLKMHFR